MQCDPCIIPESQDVVSLKLYGNAVGSTQPQLPAGIPVSYKTITIFDPAGYFKLFVRG